MQKITYFDIGTIPARVQYRDGVPVEFHYLNTATGEWEFSPRVVDEIMMGFAEEISRAAAQHLAGLKNPDIYHLEVEWLDDWDPRFVKMTIEEAKKFGVEPVPLKERPELALVLPGGEPFDAAIFRDMV